MEGVSRNDSSAHALEVWVVHLAVQKRNSPACQELYELHQSDFGSIRDNVKHGAAAEELTDAHPVQATYQLIPLPHLDAVSVAELVKPSKDLNVFFSDP